MSKLFAVIKREYLTRVRSKGFIIGTILSPLVMSSFIFIPILLARSGGPKQYRLAVIDQSGDQALYDSLKAQLEPKTPKQARYDLTREVVANESELESRKQALAGKLTTGALDGFFILPADALNQQEIKCFAKNTGGISGSRLDDGLNKAIAERRIINAGFKPDQVREMIKEVKLDIVNSRGENERNRFVIAFALLMIIYITILVYGITVMRGVTEEKQSRIIEVLLSSVRPFDLMLGKVVGIGLVGLTQYVVWAICGIVIGLLAATPALAMGGGSIPKIPVSLMIFFVIYYLLGYFLYATLYAMVGAMVSSDDDGQQFQMPISMTFAASLAISSVVTVNPTGTLATVLSLIPFFGPSLMFLRIALGAAPGWQIALSIALMIVTILACIWIAAKIYRVGVLMYGKRPTLPELARWLRYS